MLLDLQSLYERAADTPQVVRRRHRREAILAAGLVEWRAGGSLGRYRRPHFDDPARDDDDELLELLALLLAKEHEQIVDDAARTARERITLRVEVKRQDVVSDLATQP
jgi:hypothetical protein